MIGLRYRLGVLFFLWTSIFLHASDQILYKFNEQVLYTFNEQNVIKQAEEIERTLLFHNRIEKILQCASTCGILYSFWKMMTPLFDPHDKQIVKSVEPLPSQLLGNKKSSFYDNVCAVPGQLVSSVIAIPTDFIAVVMNGDLFKSVGALVGNYVLISVVNFAIESSLNKVAHRHTIGWYVQTHAPYQQTISLCIKQIDGYEQMLSRNDHKAYIEYDIMFGMCNLLLQDLERIIAYMTFRIPTIEKRYQHNAIAIKTLLFNYVLDWRSQVQDIFFVEKDIAKLKLLLDQCYNEVDRMYKMFSLYERHLKHRSIIRKLFR